MNLLIDKLPTTVEIDGVNYEIYSDFRVSIKFELLMSRADLTEEEKIINAFELYYPELPHDLNQAIDGLLWFYKSGKEEKQVKTGRAKSAKQIYSFEYDDDYIFSAYLNQYGVDLNQIEYLHWWKFKAMFKALKADNEIVKIMGYRSMVIDSKMSKEQQRYYREMQRIYQIPASKNERQKINEVEEALLNGGDLSGLIKLP